jgi:predicted DNA-binding protein with PD1-like motif
MKAKLLNDGTEPTFVLIFQTGDEVVSGLQEFAKSKNLKSSHFIAIGALSDVTFAWFDWNKREYEKAAELREQIEVLSLIGDIALDDGKPKVHAHIVVGKRDGTAHGGHLMRAHVRPTLEVILAESSQSLRREHDPESGLALIRV